MKRDNEKYFESENMIRNNAYAFRLFVGLISTAVFLINSSSGFAQVEQQATRDDFVSDASFVIGTYSPSKRAHTPAAITSAANKFITSLDEAQRGKCVSELKTPQRREWTNLPARDNADGVKMSELNSDQIKQACDLMANLFSEQGYNKMRDIMLADDQLLDEGRPRRGFGTDNFAIVIFGQPSETEPWGFQLDGHHVGTNVSVQGDKLTMSPSFIGTQPQAFKIANKTYRPFANETDLAHKLAMSLTDDQVKQAVLKDSRARILTGPGNDGLVPEAQGVTCAEFSNAQKQTLMLLISQWVNDLPNEHAIARMKQLEGELDQMKFSWNGSREPKSDVSYTIQSPSLIIEYACQDLGGNPLDHLHSNYRDPTNEYGGQLK